MFPRHSIRGCSFLVFCGLCLCLSHVACRQSAADDIRLEYAGQLLANTPEEKRPEVKLDASLDAPEGFSIRLDGPRAKIVGGGPAGALYGVGQWLSSPQPAAVALEKPDFEMRGVALLLMKEASYDFQLSPKEFPWFFDRPLLTRYLDYLLANRFNTIFLWSGHLFPSIVAMPEYQDATDLTAEELARNYDQFKWFTSECAKRNIGVLLHFYQIHLPKPLGKSRGIPIHYQEPNEFTKKFVHYSLLRFLTEFDSVGLYVCPGENLRKKYTAEWIRDVILAAAKESGRNPKIVVRNWGLDAAGFKRLCVGQYDNLYTEMKHNVEMIVSPAPDKSHTKWKDVAKKHIVNLHEAADVKPFRWGSPAFIQEMVGHWKEIGLDGAEIYGMVSWRWPYCLDKLEPQQRGFWPEGKKLLTFERDAVWQEALGRYLWKADRPRDAEVAYWTARFAETFGNAKAGEGVLQWYETAGPILPGLQNLTHVSNMNWFPTAIGKEQMVDAILKPLDQTNKGSFPYPARPVDRWFFERYKQNYGLPELTNQITMTVAEYADKQAAGEAVIDAMTPDRVADLLVELAEEGLRLAQSNQQAATASQDEAARFVTDSQALVLIAQTWRHKVQAAIAKQCFEKTGDEKYAGAMLDHVRQSVDVYEKLVALTDQTYINATDMVPSLNWHEGLKAFRADLAAQEAYVEGKKK